MLTQLIWWAGILLMALMLFRSLQGGFFKQYSLFYFYLTWVLLDTLVAFMIYVTHTDGYRSDVYRTYYWYAEFASLALGYAIIWEIYNQALAEYPGTKRIARVVVPGVFLVVLGKIFSHALSDSIWSLAETIPELERNLRTVQAMLLVVAVGLLAYYAIPVGRNLKGIILGYGFYVGLSLISLTLFSYSSETFKYWRLYLEPSGYVAALSIWTIYLWSYHPNPQPTTEVMLEQDYELLSAHTARAIARARNALLRAVRT